MPGCESNIRANDMKNTMTEQADRHTLAGDQLITVAEAAKILKASRQSVYDVINIGELPAIVGKGTRTLIWMSDLERWLQKRYTGRL